MLSPSDRIVLIETLRPPEGYRVDQVIATTYSLDLMTLLTLPLSFTLLAGDGLDESGRADPVALLDALRCYASRIHIFCQAGRIAVPPRGQPLFGYLEDSVHEATAPNGGSFHPKVTVVRYVRDPADPSWEEQPPVKGEAISYRVLCGTRNLTFDNSWDTLLVLEGDLATNRTRAFSRNRPLAEFVEALPRLCVNSVSDEIGKMIHSIADELRRVRFEVPLEFQSVAEDLKFWPIGLNKGESWFFDGELNRMAIISPFLDAEFLKEVMEATDLCAVVSRPESLAQLPQELFRRGQSWFILNEGTDAELDSGQEFSMHPQPADKEGGAGDHGIAVEPSGAQERGLHAKLFLAEDGGIARIWTGSANATRRAFRRNVEFLVELRGRRAKVGIDSLLSPGDAVDSSSMVQFSSLLQPYEPTEESGTSDDIERQLENLLEDASRQLVDAHLLARVTPREKGTEKQYDVCLAVTAPDINELSSNVTLGVRPITLSPEHSVQVSQLSGSIAKFQGLAFLSLTAFYAIALTASLKSQKKSREFVLRAPLDGAPKDRENQLLLAILSDRDHLLRYLLMLLGNSDDLSSLIQSYREGSAGNGFSGWGNFEMPLLESILRAYADNPARLEPIGRLIRDLESTEQGRRILPDELRSLWAAIRLAGGDALE